MAKKKQKMRPGEYTLTVEKRSDKEAKHFIKLKIDKDTKERIANTVIELVDNAKSDKPRNKFVEHLKGLTGLRELDLYGTKITDAGADSLRKALPEADIIK